MCLRSVWAGGVCRYGVAKRVGRKAPSCAAAWRATPGRGTREDGDLGHRSLFFSFAGTTPPSTYPPQTATTTITSSLPSPPVFLSTSMMFCCGGPERGRCAGFLRSICPSIPHLLSSARPNKRIHTQREKWIRCSDASHTHTHTQTPPSSPHLLVRLRRDSQIAEKSGRKTNAHSRLNASQGTGTLPSEAGGRAREWGACVLVCVYVRQRPAYMTGREANEKKKKKTQWLDLR